MRVSFYAPLKPPDHPVPSGDRRVARLLIAALEAAGHAVAIASRFRSFEPAGDPAAQACLAEAAAGEVERVVAARPAPDLWLTYHCYYKAPDLIGPAAAARLGIPYAIYEPSFAPKRATGPWAKGHAAAAAAITRADLLLCPTRLDMACVGRIAAADRLRHFPPFLDAAPFRGVDRAASRAALAGRYDLACDRPWLLAVAMMRTRDKLESYRRLARALALLEAPDWRLLIVGDGEARAEVEAAFRPFEARVRFAGAAEPDALPAFYAAADLLVWPAAGEAYGMAFLEAAAAGLPAVAGRVRGVPEVVEDGQSGILVPEDDAPAFARAVDRLLADPSAGRHLAEGARRMVAADRDLPAAARRLDAELRAVLARAR